MLPNGQERRRRRKKRRGTKCGCRCLKGGVSTDFLSTTYVYLFGGSQVAATNVATKSPLPSPPPFPSPLIKEMQALAAEMPWMDGDLLRENEKPLGQHKGLSTCPFPRTEFLARVLENSRFTAGKALSS